MATADGSIIFSVSLDDKKAQQELNRLKAKIKSLESSISTKESKQSPLLQQAAKLRKELEAAQAEARRYGEEWRNGALGADSKQADAAARVRKIRTEYQGVSEKINKVQAQLQPARENLEQLKEAAGNLERQLNQAREAESSRLQGIRESARVSNQHIVNITQELGTLKERLKTLKAAGVGAGHEEYDKIIARINEINKELKEYQAATRQVASNTSRIASTTAAVGASMNKLVSRIVGLTKRVFFFSLITAGLRSIRTWLWNAIRTSDEATAAIAKMKGAFLTLAQPLVSVIIPAFTKLVELLAEIATFAANIIAPLFGTTVEESAQAAKNLYEESKALDETGKKAKKAEKSLASFDEINKLTDNSKKDKTKKDDKIAPDFSGIVGGQLGALEAIIGGALLAIGAILTFSGVNIPLGITLMVLGALTLYSVMKENWGEISKILQGELGILLGIISGALLILGAILAFSGVNIPMGLGLMALGAAGLATAYAANWDTMKKVLDGPLGILLAALSGALLVIGAIFVFSGVNLPLGIGLMVAGAIGMATVVAANWDHIVEKLQGPLGVVLAIVSGALLVLGAIILFSGANIPLGLGLMIAGAIGLASVVAANWDTVKKLLQGPIGVLIGVVSGALLVIGAIFTFSGANIPFGIALMLVGAAGLAAVVAVNWDTIRKALEGPVGAVVALLSGAMLALGGILTFSGHPLLGIGLIAAGAIGLAATVAVNWDSIPELMKGPVGAITALMSTALLAVGAVLAFGAVNIPLGIALMAVGAAGLATAIAPNWDAIISALQGPIGVLVGVISGALLVLGVILLFNPATLPLGLGLIAAGAAGLATAIAPNWNTIVDALKGVWESVKNLWASIVGWWNDTIVAGFNSAKDFISDNFIEPIYSFFSGLVERIKSIFEGVVIIIQAVWIIVTSWFSEHIIEPLKSLFETVGNAITTAFNTALDWIKNTWGAITAWFNENVIKPVKDAWSAVTSWFSENVIEPLKSIFNSLWSTIASGVTWAFNSILSTIESVLNFIISMINKLLSGFNAVVSAAAKITGSDWKGVEMIPKLQFSKLPVPKLATGAVIPPNREFLAVLGDQKSGTNIEAPVSEIENAVIRGIQRAGGLSGGSHTAILEIDKRVLGRVMWEENETQSSRMGVRIVQRANT